MKKQILNGIIICYILVLVLVLFIPFGGRVQQTWINNGVFSREHFMMSNIIPFKMIIEYVNSWKNGSMNVDIIIRNIFGNIVLFMPVGILLPMKFKTMKNSIFAVINILFNVAIEIIQFLTLYGSFDIDDIILHLLGAYIAYFVYCKKIKKI